MSGAVGRKSVVPLTIESKDGLVALDENRAFDQVRLLHHEVDRFLLRLRQWTLFEDGTARADEFQEPGFIDVPLQKLTVRRMLVDVAFGDVDLVRLQKTSGISAGGSGGLPVERRSHALHSTAVLGRG
jgi:hypothetical protein